MTTGSVIIPLNQTVVLDTNLNLNNLTSYGKVTSANKNLNIHAGWILVKGRLSCGTSLNPYRNKLIITLTGINGDENILNLVSKFLAAIDTGSIQLQGNPRANWRRLGFTSNKGTNQVQILRLVMDFIWRPVYFGLVIRIIPCATL